LAGEWRQGNRLGWNPTQVSGDGIDLCRPGGQVLQASKSESVTTGIAQAMFPVVSIGFRV